MLHNVASIRPFIGAQNFNESRRFYSDLGFRETAVLPNMSLFALDRFAFYLQDAYIKEWVDNTMVFLEVNNVEQRWKDVEALDLPGRYKNVRVLPIRTYDWGREFFVHDPSGVLWHIGEFTKR